MFSPSLISSLFHAGSISDSRSFETTREVADFLKLRTRPDHGEWPVLPVVGWTQSSFFRDEFGIRPFRVESRSGALFARRIRWDVLRDLFVKRVQLRTGEPPGESEFLDLAVPLEDYSIGKKTVNTAKSRCQSMMAKAAAPGKGQVVLALLERGKPSRPGPESFNGMLQQVGPSNMGMSDHAILMLATMLDQLPQKQLPMIEFVCSLAHEPSSNIGFTFFRHYGLVELSQAWDELLQHLTKYFTQRASICPVVFNISQGAHVGPHNGCSPFEDLISPRRLSSSYHVCAAAGNEGLSAKSARIEIAAAVEHRLMLRTGPRGGDAILIEFWWHEPSDTKANVQFEVDFDYHRNQKAAGYRPLTSLTLSAANAGANLSTTTLHGSVNQATLFKAKCHNGMSGATLMVSSSSPADLALLEMLIRVNSNVALVLNSWIVISPDRWTAFVDSGFAGSVGVPATHADQVISVSAHDQGQPWHDSSSGVVGHYESTPPTPGAPWLSHAYNYQSVKGTSVACARTAADLAALLVKDPRAVDQATNAKDVADEILNRSKTKRIFNAWSPQLGNGSIKIK